MTTRASTQKIQFELFDAVLCVSTRAIAVVHFLRSALRSVRHHIAGLHFAAIDGGLGDHARGLIPGLRLMHPFIVDTEAWWIKPMPDGDFHLCPQGLLPHGVGL